MKLYRGCTRSEAYWTKELRTVGGLRKRDKESALITKPTEPEVKMYVANHEGRPPVFIKLSEKQLIQIPQPPDDRELCEYSDRITVANHFSRGYGWLISVEIDEAYLSKGSDTESGWIARVGAPAANIQILRANKTFEEEQAEITAATPVERQRSSSLRCITYFKSPSPPSNGSEENSSEAGEETRKRSKSTSSSNVSTPLIIGSPTFFGSPIFGPTVAVSTSSKPATLNLEPADPSTIIKPTAF